VLLCNFRIIMSSLSERLRDSKYANWLQVTIGLSCMKDGLHTMTERVMAEFQAEIRERNNIVQACSSESCDSKAIRSQGVDKFQCPNNVCNSLLKSILAEHGNAKQIVWENFEMRQWPEKCWEIAKVYMSRGYTAAEAASTDCAGLLQLISNCKQFQSKMQLNKNSAAKVKLSFIYSYC